NPIPIIPYKANIITPGVFHMQRKRIPRDSIGKRRNRIKLYLCNICNSSTPVKKGKSIKAGSIYIGGKAVRVAETSCWRPCIIAAGATSYFTLELNSPLVSAGRQIGTSADSHQVNC